MREILFRGKRKDNGKFVEGYYRYDDIPPFTNEPRTEIVRGGAHRYGYSMIPYEVIPETVGQYTGLTDKKGKKIFEGDIVKETYEIFTSERKKEKRTRIGYVEYSACSFCNGYYAYFWNDKEKWRGNFAIHCGCEVIGNIHDNPELMEEEQE